MNNNTEVEDDWRQCAEWLNRCQVLPDDHPALGPEGSPLHLVQTLMDGVALCRVLTILSNNEIDVRTMKDFSPNPQNSQFLCCQNIRLFIQLCQKEFSIDDSILIQPEDIYQLKNFGKALDLLSALSLCGRSQTSGIIGFPSGNAKLQTTHEYYNNLGDYASTLDKLQDPSRTNYTQMDEENKEKLYDTVVHQRLQPAISSETTSARGSCMREIVDTEKNYVDLLKMLLDKYKLPLTGVLSVEELEEILMYIEELHTIHRELLSDLSLYTSQKQNVISLSDIFLKVRDRLLIYGEYCGHVQHAQSLVLELMRNDVEKRSRIESCQAHSEKYSKFHLTELLTVPIQRVLKYHLLLEQLRKLTPIDHPERSGLTQALESMKELAQFINEVKRDLDTISAIDQIQSSLSEITLPPDKKLSSYGRRHMDGEVKVLNPPEMRPKIRYLFLFDKILIICKPKGDNFTFMLAYHIINGPFNEVQLPVKKSEKYCYGFDIPLGEEHAVINLTFAVKSAEVRDTWLQAIRNAVSNLNPVGAKDKGYNFEMFTFAKPTYCRVCNKLLQGIFYQGYRCRETGIAVHKICLESDKLPARSSQTPNTNHSGHPANGMGLFQYPPPLPPSVSGGTVRSNSGRRTILPASMASPVHLSRTSSASTTFPTIPNTSPSKLTMLSDALSLVNQWSSCGPNGSLPPHNRRTTSALFGSQFCQPNQTLLSGVIQTAYSCESGVDLSPGNTVDIVCRSDDGGWCRAIFKGVECSFPSRILDPISIKPHRTTMSAGPMSRQLAHFSSPPLTPSHSISGLSQPMRAVQHRSSLSFDGREVNGMRYENSKPNSWVTFDVDFDASKPQPDIGEPPTGFDWYMGEMDRHEAVALLRDCDNGTFLVRISKSVERQGEYSLSFVYFYPRHIRIQRFMSPDNCSFAYGLWELEKFPSIPSLIDYYSKVSLNNCFDEVDTVLLHPYQRCPSNIIYYVRANFDFSDDSDDRMLTIKRDDVIAVISRIAEERGWLKGWVHGRMGFFPMSYVGREQTPVS